MISRGTARPLLSTASSLVQLSREFTRPFAAILSRIDRELLGSGRKRPQRPPTFVVGPPRCGTTLVYLHIVNQFRCAYVPNLAKFLPSATRLLSAAARYVDDYEPTYESFFGHVSGANAPSDAWYLLEDLFEDDHLGSEEQRILGRIVADVESIYDGPFVLKNNRNCLRLEALAEAFPNALFVGVFRDVDDAALSLARARKMHGVAVEEHWSCPPPVEPSWRVGSQLEAATHTTVSLTRHLRRRLSQFVAHPVFSVNYRDFCNTPGELVDWLEQRYSDFGVSLERRPSPPLPDFEVSDYESAKVPQSTRELVSERLESSNDSGRAHEPSHNAPTEGSFNDG